jgi:hypothetical protein
MGAVIPAGILEYEGQVIKEVRQDAATGKGGVPARPSPSAGRREVRTNRFGQKVTEWTRAQPDRA